jgi:hypothetical protein
MPCEIVRIEINSSVPHYEPAARYFSVLAYPDQRDMVERKHFESALCQWVIRSMAKGSKDWANNGQSIRPVHFIIDSKQAHKKLKRGLKELFKRFAATHYVVMPHLNAIVIGHVDKFDDLTPTVENMLGAMAIDMGWKGENLSTAKTKIWKPAWPVVHAIAAVLIVKQKLGKDIEQFPLGKLCRMPIEFFLLYPETVKTLVEVSEIYRVERLPQIKQFRIKEDDTIQFIVV